MPRYSVIIPTSSELTPHRENLLTWVIDRYDAFFGWGLPILLGEDGSDPFNRARARNDALNRVNTEFVLIADGDTAFDPGAINQGLDLLEVGAAPWVIPYGDKDYYNLTEEYTNSVLSDPMDPLLEPIWDHRIKSWAGLLIARTADCLSIGYDERFEGWGWEDVAFRIKLDAHIGRHQRIPEGRALHLWHPRGDDEFDSPQELKNRELFNREYRVPYNWRDERIR